MNIYAIFILSTLMIVIRSVGKIIVESSNTHNSNCYTQGLFFINNTHLFETCGLYGQSYFHLMEYQSNPFLVRQSYSSRIPWKSDIFMEGAILFSGYLYLLTWQQMKVYKLNSTNYSVVKQLKWNKQGWGLTTNGMHMFTTDGSDKIYVVDENFTLLSEIGIKNSLGNPQTNINELEFVGGFIYANVYMTTKIIKIDIKLGKVVSEYEGGNLVQSQNNLKYGQVLNGIAYDKNSGKFILTGKHWSKIYQVTFQQFQSCLLSVLAMIVLMFFIA